jgi:hypothetical protein
MNIQFNPRQTNPVSTSKTNSADKFNNSLALASLIGATSLLPMDATAANNNKQAMTDLHAAPADKIILVNDSKAIKNLKSAKVAASKLSAKEQLIKSQFINLLTKLKADNIKIPFSKIIKDDLESKNDQSGIEVTLNGVKGKLSKTHHTMDVADLSGTAKLVIKAIKFTAGEKTKDPSINNVALREVNFYLNENDQKSISNQQFITINDNDFSVKDDVDDYTEFNTKIKDPKNKTTDETNITSLNNKANNKNDLNAQAPVPVGEVNKVDVIASRAKKVSFDQALRVAEAIDFTVSKRARAMYMNNTLRSDLSNIDGGINSVGNNGNTKQGIFKINNDDYGVRYVRSFKKNSDGTIKKTDIGENIVDKIELTFANLNDKKANKYGLVVHHDDNLKVTHYEFQTYNKNGELKSSTSYQAK